MGAPTERTGQSSTDRSDPRPEVGRVNRRDLLRTIAGAVGGAASGASGPATATAGHRPADPATTGSAGDRPLDRTTKTASEIDDCADGDAVSLRCLGAQLDPERPARRLGGNRPPELREESVGRDLSYLTPVYTPEFLEAPPARPGAVRKRTARRHGRDAGLLNAGSFEKGLLELYRYPESASEPSIREVAERHRSGNTFTLLLFNAGLFEVAGVNTHYDDIDQRPREIGRMIRENGYDVVGLNEVWYAHQREALLSEAGPKASMSVTNDELLHDNNGLVTALFGDRGSVPRDVSRAYGPYIDGTVGERHVEKGWQRMEIDLGPGNVDLYVTHTNHGQGARANREVRLDQIDRLIDNVEQRQRDRPGNVTILGGDLNVLGNRTEYDEMVRRFDDRVNLQDVWLTRGGTVSMTSYFEDVEFWENVGDPPEWPSGCLDYDRGCHCDDYRSEAYVNRPEFDATVDDNARLDYVFLERPSDDHDLRIDVQRVRRKLFPRLDGEQIRRQSGAGEADRRRTADCATERADCPEGSNDCNSEPYLSDHMGLEVEILASPA